MSSTSSNRSVMPGRVAAALAATTIGAAFGLVSALPAAATNIGTQSGNATSGCAVTWNAHTIMDADGVQAWTRT